MELISALSIIILVITLIWIYTINQNVAFLKSRIFKEDKGSFSWEEYQKWLFFEDFEKAKAALKSSYWEAYSYHYKRNSNQIEFDLIIKKYQSEFDRLGINVNLGQKMEMPKRLK